MKSKDAMKMLKHLKITPQQAQSLIDAKLTTNKKLIRFLKEIVTPSPSKEKKETKPKKNGKKKKEKPLPTTTTPTVPTIASTTGARAHTH